jgi:hypothetical protein
MLFIALLIFQVAGQVPCNTTLDCEKVAYDPTFVECLNNTCRCIQERGFVGSATRQEKCNCNGTVQTIDNKTWCANLEAALAWNKEQNRNRILKEKVAGIYTSIVWPSSTTIAAKVAAGNLTGGVFDFFNHNVEGRIDPLGEIHGQDGVVEYFVGQVWTGQTIVYDAYFNKLFTSGNKVFMDVHIMFRMYPYFPDVSVSFDYNLTQTGTFTFGDDDKIILLDLVIRNVDWAVEAWTSQSLANLQRICYTIVHVAKCDATHDADGYYADMQECMSFIGMKKWGTWDRIRDDSALCRQYHSVLAILRPDLHCSHTGKTGGGKCIVKNYRDQYNFGY